MEETFDFVIVEAGSAACVLANRLTASGRFRVLLLEAGGSHNRLFVKMPLGFGKLFYDGSLNWKYQAEPDERLGGRSDYWPRGKILGGSSSINAMVYIRGQRRDYDDWAALGNTGWGYDDVLPYFKKSEDNERGPDEFHGVGGPLKISGIEHRVLPSDHDRREGIRLDPPRSSLERRMLWPMYRRCEADADWRNYHFVKIAAEDDVVGCRGTEPAEEGLRAHPPKDHVELPNYGRKSWIRGIRRGKR